MNFLVAFLVAVTLAASPTPGGGGGGSNNNYGISKGSPEIALHLKQPLVSGNSVKLGYEIPYSGYIEFHLFDNTDTKIWVDYYVRERGEHVQALRLDKLTPGQDYHYEFWYKGKPYPGKFKV